MAPIRSEIEYLRRRVVDLEFELGQKDSELRMLRSRKLVSDRIRSRIYEMEVSEDMAGVLLAVRDGLSELCVPFDSCGVNLVDAASEPPSVTIHSLSSDGSRACTLAGHHSEMIVGLWRGGAVAYRQDLDSIDCHCEAAVLESKYAYRVRSIVDVPFAYGTLAVNSSRCNAFSQADIDVLQELAGVLSEGFTRLHDLRVASESEAKYRDLVENIDDIIYSLDTQGRITYISPVVERLGGYSPSDVIGRSFEDFVYPEDAPGVVETFQNAVGGRRTSSEFRVRVKSGEVRWVRGSIRAIDQNGTVVGLQGVLADIAERKEEEEKKSVLEQQLRQAQKMEGIGRLAGGVAHDFNNLLTIILGTADLALLRLPQDHPMRSSLHEICKAGQRATDLIRQMLGFARRQIIQPQSLCLNELILNLSNMLGRLIGEDVELCVIQAPDLGLVEVDPGQVEQVLVNLVVNSRDAMPRGGTITIETRNVTLDANYVRQHRGAAEGDYVAIALTDNGIGMPEEVKAHLFEPFFTTKDVGKGTGLGMATCYGIVKQNQGYIWVDSSPGEGTTVTVHLPRIQVEAAATAPGLPAEVGRLPGGIETVLVVEDEDEVRGLVCALLRESGYSVIEAACAEDALSAAKARGDGTIDLLLTDVVMPRMGGRELADCLRVLRPETRTLFMSGYADDTVLRHGVVDLEIAFIQKPFKPEALARKVREVLAAPRI